MKQLLLSAILLSIAIFVPCKDGGVPKPVQEGVNVLDMSGRAGFLASGRTPSAGRIFTQTGNTESMPAGTRALDCVGPTALSHGVPVNDTTVGARNNASEYCGWGPDYQWSGLEVVYTFTTTQVSDLRVVLTNITPQSGTDGDVDIFVLGSCDEGDCWSWGDEALTIPDAPADTYTIVVDGWDGDEASYTITAWEARELLLVDDDHSGPGTSTGYADTAPTYNAALNNIGANNHVPHWNVDFLGAPTSPELWQYKHVIWVTGEDRGTTSPAHQVIAGDEEGILASYLDAGGKLILVSQGYLRDVTGGIDGLQGEGTFAFQYLNVSSVQNSLTGYEAAMQGANGDPIGDDGAIGTGTTTLALSLSSPVPNEAAGFQTLYAEAVYRTTSGVPTVLRYQGPYSDSERLVFASIPLENITPSAGLETFLQRSLDWLDLYYYPAIARGAAYVDGAIANGIPDPGEDIGLTFLLQNNDENIDIDAHAYLVIHDTQVTAPTYNDTILDMGTVLNSRCTPPPDPCNLNEGDFSMTVDSLCPIGHRVVFSVNLWVDDGTGMKWRDTSGYGFYVGQADTLLVKDEELYPNSSGIGPYKQALQGAGFTYALHDNAVFASPVYDDPGYMSNLLMKNYNHIIWMTGQDWMNTLTTEDETELKALMDAGGKLLLVSQDYFWDYFGGDGCEATGCSLISGEFAYDYLGITQIDHDVVAKNVASVAVDGDPAEDLAEDFAFSLAGEKDQVIPNEADAILGTVSGIRSPRALFEFPGNQTTGQIYEGKSAANQSAYRVVSLWFPFENLLERTWPNTRTLLLKRILYWMDRGDTQSNTVANPAGTYYYPTDPASLTVTPGTGTDADLAWTEVTTNTNGVPIDITYHLHKGTSPQGLIQDPTEYSVNNTTDTTVPSPGQCIYYKVRAVDLLQIESQ